MPVPPESAAKEAERGLEWRDKHNRGGTAVGVARARDIANRRNLSDDTVRRMVSYFARHEVDKQGQGWSPGEDGYPSAGRIAWALWGGDPGRTWAESEVRKMGDRQERTREELSCGFRVTECHEVTQSDDGTICRFEGIASIFGQRFDAYVPARNRIEPTMIHPGAFAKTIQERDPNKVKLYWQHRTDLPPVGAAVRLSEAREGLIVSGRIVGTSLGGDVATLVRTRVLDELSIGATAIKYDFEDDDDGETMRHVREYMLHEVSVVDEGANPGSRVTDVMRRYDDVFWSDLAARCRDASDEEVLRIVQAPFRDEHAGKVLSGKNKTLVQQAIDALQALIAAAEPQAAPDQDTETPALTVPRSELLNAALRLTELGHKLRSQGVQ